MLEKHKLVGTVTPDFIPLFVCWKLSNFSLFAKIFNYQVRNSRLRENLHENKKYRKSVLAWSYWAQVEFFLTKNEGQKIPWPRPIKDEYILTFFA